MRQKILHKFINGIECRKCSHCNEWKPISAFYKCKSRWDGIEHDCKKCKCNQGKTYRMNNREERLDKRRQKYVDEIKDSEHQKEYVKQYIATHKEQSRIYKKKYREEHIEEIKCKNKEYYDRTKEQRAIHAKQYRQTPRGKETGRIHVIRRRSILKNIICTLTIEEWNNIIKKQRNLCAGCLVEFSASVKPEIDHIIPISKGGNSTKENTQALCRSCNSSKRDKLNWTYPFVKEWT